MSAFICRICGPSKGDMEIARAKAEALREAADAYAEGRRQISPPATLLRRREAAVASSWLRRRADEIEAGR